MYNLEKEKDNYYHLGRVLKVHGYKGEVVFLLDTDKPEEYEGLDKVFLNMDGALVPWFIKNIRISDKLAIVKLEDISNPDQAAKLLKKDIYLPLDSLGELSGNDFYYHEIIGFSVQDKRLGDIGIVEEVLERKEQELIRILKGKNEILIPLVDDMIRKVDRKRKILHINTPEGLIDIYLE